MDCYTSDWVVVNRKYQQYSTSQRQVEPKEERLRGLANHQYECDSVSPDMTPQDQVRGSVRFQLEYSLIKDDEPQ